MGPATWWVDVAGARGDRQGLAHHTSRLAASARRHGRRYSPEPERWAPSEPGVRRVACHVGRRVVGDTRRAAHGCWGGPRCRRRGGLSGQQRGWLHDRGRDGAHARLGLRANADRLHALADGRLAAIGLVDPPELRRAIAHAGAGLPVDFSTFEPVIAAEVWLGAVAVAPPVRWQRQVPPPTAPLQPSHTGLSGTERVSEVI